MDLRGSASEIAAAKYDDSHCMPLVWVSKGHESIALMFRLWVILPAALIIGLAVWIVYGLMKADKQV